MFRFVQIVGGEDDGGAAFGQSADDLPGLTAGGCVEAGGRLVEEDQIGIANHRGGEIESALLTAGEFGAAPIGVLGEADQLERVVRVHRVVVESRREVEHFARRQSLHRRAALEHDPDASVELAALTLGVVAEHGDLTCVALAVALEDFDQGRLAGSVGSEERVDLSGIDLQVDGIDGGDRSVSLGDAADADR